MAAIRKQWFFVVKIKTGKSKFTCRHTSDLENYGDAVTEMVDSVRKKIDWDHGFEFTIINNTVRYG